MKRLPLRFAVSATCAMAALSVGASAFGAMLDGLRKEHPRVLLTDDRLQELKRLAGEDAALKTAADGIITLAGLYLDKPPVTDSTDWNQWRETTARTFATAFAWRWTGDEKYLKMARETLLTAAAFDDWYEKRQFLDTSEMTLALAVGYDWLYPALADADREVIRTAIIEKGLKNGLKDYAGGSQRSWWIASNHNWNLVCNAGMVVGALAVAESDSQTAAAVLEAAVKSMPFALESYKPDGAWMEGPYYWEFATRYAVMALASLQTALGSDFGLSENPGLARTWRFGAYVTGPNGLTVMAFADSLEHHWSLPFAFWAATRYNDPLAAQYEMQYFGKPHPWWADPAKEVDDPRHAPNRVLDVVWYSPPPDGTPTLKDALPLNTVLRGKVELASFRSAWDDPKALWVTVKAGPNGGLVNHGQCDAGSFELHAGGVRWAFDPGRAGYGAGYFDVGSADKPGARWGYAKAAARGHNVLLLDNANQDPFAEAPITKFIDTEAVAAAVVDLSGVYRGYATSASRGVQMLNRQCVVVQDELELDQPREVTWGMNTEAEITCNEAKAGLKRWGQKLDATILSPTGAVFSAREPADGLPRRLVVTIKAGKGPLRIAVFLCPQPQVAPLAEWK